VPVKLGCLVQATTQPELGGLHPCRALPRHSVKASMLERGLIRLVFRLIYNRLLILDLLLVKHCWGIGTLTSTVRWGGEVGGAARS
jgi:hypothetical protein